MTIQWSVLLVYSFPENLTEFATKMEVAPVIGCSWNWPKKLDNTAANFYEVKNNITSQILMSQLGNEWVGKANALCTKQFASEAECQAWVERADNIAVQKAQMVFVIQSKLSTA